VEAGCISANRRSDGLVLRIFCNTELLNIKLKIIFMRYYLIAEKDAFKICLVKEKDRSRFVQYSRDKIRLCGSSILVLLKLIHIDANSQYVFSDN
jgi:hypothetical protein